MGCDKKKLLVLGGSEVNKKLVETAKEMGVYVIIADNSINSPCKKIADENHLISILDVQRIVNLCKKENIDGIANICNDLAAKSIQKISEIIGFPSVGTYEQVMTFSDKCRFKDACKKNHIDVIDGFTEEDAMAGMIEWPIMVKPIDGRGSAGTIICESQEWVHEAIRMLTLHLFRTKT